MAQPKLSIADQLERASADLDRLCADARLGRPGNQLRLHDLEERAQRIASALVAPFRGRDARPVNPPLEIKTDSAGRTRAGW